jgi:hypothetical protein
MAWITIPFEIPMKPHLVKYAISLYGPKVYVTKKSSLGLFINVLLKSKKVNDGNCIPCIRFIPQMRNVQSSLTVNIRTRVSVRNPNKNVQYFLSDMSIVYINRFLEEQLDESIYQYCKFSTLGAKSQRRNNDLAIQEFAEAHGIIIGTDVKFETLKKREYRYRKALTPNNKTSK